MGGISSRLRGLWREINAYGGRGKSEYDAGYERGIECALDVLEAAGFSEGKSTAADKIDADAAFMEEVREVLEGFCPPKLAEIESLLWDGIDDSAHGAMTVTCGQMRRARALLAKMEGK